MVETSVSLGRTPDGRRVEVSGRLAVAPATAWDALVDTERWPAWGPSVRDVNCDQRRIRANSTGRVRLPGGLWVPFRVTAFEDGRRWTWSVARVPATGHRVEPVTPESGDGPTVCRVVFEVPLLAGGYVPVCRRAIGDLERLLGE